MRDNYSIDHIELNDIFVGSANSDSVSKNNLSSFLNGTQVFYPAADVIITSPYWLTLTGLASLGNVIILSVILFNPRFRKPANYLVANYSFSCLLFTLSTNLRLLENSSDLWPYSTCLCQALVVLHRIPIPVVALTTMVISLDRGRVARHPVGRSSLLNPFWKIIIIWCFSVMIVLPLALTREVDRSIRKPYKCVKVKMFESSMISLVYGLCYLLSIHIGPAAILIQESVKTRSKMKFLRLSRGPQLEERGSHPMVDGRLKMLRNSCIFTVIFLLVWLPYGIFQFPMDIPRGILPDIFSTYIKLYFTFFRDITYIQICLNPVILFVLSYELNLRSYITCLCC